jgi:excisionase family DNA binding protein
MLLMLEYRVFTPKEVAHTLRVDEETIRREIRREHLTAVQIGRQYRISSGDLVRWLGRERFLELFAPVEALTSIIGAGRLDPEETLGIAERLVRRARQETPRVTEAEAPSAEEVRKRRR